MYDFVIIGGGIVGLSVGMNLGKRFPNASILIVEKENKIASHQTGHNSGVIHSGIYYKPNSFKAEFTRKGNESIVEFCKAYDLPYEVCGKFIVANKESELPLLQNLYQQGLENNLDVEKASAEEIKEQEPHVKCLEGIRVRKAGITDYTKICQKYMDLIQEQGGELKLNTRVIGIKNTEKSKVLETTQGTIETKFMINCSGLYSDFITRLDGFKPPAQIIPYRGEYYKLKSEKNYLVNSLIYPVPNPEFPFLGVHFTRMIDGSVHAGPNAVLSLKREGYKKTDFDLKEFFEIVTYKGFWKLIQKHTNEGMKEIIRSFSKIAFVKSLQQLIPEVTINDVISCQAGVRAQALKDNGSLVDDFLIIQNKNSLHVCNAPSPAATASLEIGKYIVNQISS